MCDWSSDVCSSDLPHHSLYFVVIPHLDVKWAVGGNLYSPPSFAVGYRMKNRGVEGHEVGVNYCCLLTLHLAGELEVDCNRIGLHLSLSRHCNEGEEGEDDVLIQICQNLSASFFSSVLLNWPTWKSCSMSLPSLLTKAPRGMAVKFSMVSNCFHSLLVI